MAVLYAAGNKLNAFADSDWANYLTNEYAVVGVIDASPDGLYIAIGHTSSPYVEIYDARTATSLQTLSGAGLTPYYVKFTPDGSHLYVAWGASGAYNITRYSTTDFSVVSHIMTTTNANAYGLCVVFSPDSTKVALCFRETSELEVKVYNVTGTSITTLYVPYGTFSENMWSPDGSFFAVPQGTSSTKKLAVYNTSNWSLISTTPTYSVASYTVLWAPDSSRLYVRLGGAPSLSVLDTATWSEITLNTTLSISTDFFLKDNGATLVWVAGSGNSRIVNTSDLTLGGTFLPDISYSISRASLSPDGKYLAILISSSPYLRVYDFSSGQQITISGVDSLNSINTKFAWYTPSIFASVFNEEIDASTGFITYGTAGFSSSFYLEDTLDVQSLLSFLSSLVLSSSINCNAQVSSTFSDSYATSAACTLIANLLSSDTLDLAEDMTSSLALACTFAEMLTSTDNAEIRTNIATAFLEAVALKDAVYAVAEMSAEETLGFADSLSTAIQAELASAETLALQDELSHSIFLTLPESIDLDDTAALNVHALMSLEDGIRFIINLPLEDGDYQAWVMNADTTGVTSYSNFPFNSLFPDPETGTPLGLTETGLYELEGDTDDGEPISAFVATGDHDFGTGREKNCPRAYLYITQAGPMVLKTITSARGTRHETFYEVALRDATDDDSLRRVPLGRGVRGVWWRYEIHNVDGSDFNLDGAEVLPVVLSRRG